MTRSHRQAENGLISGYKKAEKQAREKKMFRLDIPRNIWNLLEFISDGEPVPLDPVRVQRIGDFRFCLRSKVWTGDTAK